jgi:NADH:ubiquinone oxidoreductase subunit
MARSYINIERALPTKFYQYVGWDRSGNQYIIQKHDSYRGYRAAQVVVTDNTIPYFYARTLRDVSGILQNIN